MNGGRESAVASTGTGRERRPETGRRESLNDRLQLGALLDALPGCIAALDRTGTVVAANQAWRRLADEAGSGVRDHGLGIEGLTLLDAAMEAEEAAVAAAGIRSVLTGERPGFVVEYPCPSRPDQCWSKLSAAPVRYRGAQLVLAALQPLAERKPAEDDGTEAFRFEEIVGRSDTLHQVFRQMAPVARTDATVLLLGETGTGKELVARAIHERSPRKHRRLVKVNCAALPPTLIESELFGHEKGAFTGAVERTLGRFELADGGTIFLDEIGDLPPGLQVKLLRVLQEGEFERVGSSRTSRVDVRVIAATNRDLEKAMADGLFRADLYYRLRVFPILLPPLRERRDDIPLLVHYFVARCRTRLGRTVETVPQPVMNALTAYPWPGNVRELESVVERAVILSPGRTLRLDEPLDAGGTAWGAPPSEALAHVERGHIVHVLEQCGWRLKGKGNAAERLDIHPSTLRSRMKKLGIGRPRTVAAA